MRLKVALNLIAISLKVEKIILGPGHTKIKKSDKKQAAPRGKEDLCEEC
jgi:hypothetical protein